MDNFTPQIHEKLQAAISHTVHTEALSLDMNMLETGTVAVAANVVYLCDSPR
jgi:hypothetical protein